MNNVALLKSEEDKNYSDSKPFNLLTFKIDYLILRSSKNRDAIDRALTENNFKQVADVWVSGRRPYKKTTYQNGTYKVVIFHWLKKRPSETQVLIHLPQPSPELCHILYSIFEWHYIPYDLSCLSVAWDFYANDPVKFTDFILTHLFLKQEKYSSDEDYEFCNIHNIKGWPKGVYVYPMEVDGRGVSRILLVLSQEELEGCNLQLPINIDCMDFAECYFEFMWLDFEDIKNSVLYRHSLIKEAELANDRKAIKNIRDCLRKKINRMVDKKRLMEIVEIFRRNRFTPYLRYLRRIEWLTELIDRSVKEREIHF
jgi:hypothetical protein